MNRTKLLEDTINYLKIMPEDKISEVYDFVEYLYLKHESYILKKGIQKLESETESFKFLSNEQDIYSVADIKEKYNAEG